MNLDDLMRDAVRHFKPPRYPDAFEGMLRLDANTNLMGANPVVERVLANVAAFDVAQYPTPFSEPLRAALSKTHGMPAAQFIVGNGSDEIFDFVTKTFINRGDTIAVAAPSFVMHAFYGRVNLGLVVEVPLHQGFQPDVDELLSTRAKLTILATPNNPTGNAFQPARLERLLRETEGLVLIDEAYAEYADGNWLARLAEFPNLIVTRTFSKAYGLAGLRVGYAAASAGIVERLHRVKPPFTVNTISERIAIEALEDPRFMRGSVAAAKAERKALIQGLMERKIIAYPSEANFVLARTGAPPGLVAQRLSARNILVRDMSDVPGLEGCIRITVGTIEQHDRLFDSLDGAP